MNIQEVVNGANPTGKIANLVRRTKWLPGMYFKILYTTDSCHYYFGEVYRTRCANYKWDPTPEVYHFDSEGWEVYVEEEEEKEKKFLYTYSALCIMYRDWLEEMPRQRFILTENSDGIRSILFWSKSLHGKEAGIAISHEPRDKATIIYPDVSCYKIIAKSSKRNDLVDVYDWRKDFPDPAIKLNKQIESLKGAIAGNIEGLTLFWDKFKEDFE